MPSAAALAQEPGRDREIDRGRPRDGAPPRDDGSRRDGPPRRDGVEPRVQPPDDRPGSGRERWTLGATVETLDAGVRVREVLPRSAAERAGLERDDVIITVNGYQVGRVEGREFPLEDELQQRTDSAGRVRLLVLDRRTNRLVTLDVQLERDRPAPPPLPREAIITGEVTYRERMALPRGAELRVKLIRRKFIGSETITERTYKLNGQPPVPFELRYPLIPGDRDKNYEVEAEIVVDGRRWFSQDGTYRVRAGDPESRVDINMRRR